MLNETVFNVSLPDIATELGITPSAANWINTSFMLSFAVGTALYGQISDRTGTKKLLVIGLLVYGGGSLLGALLHVSYGFVLLARFVQGAGASAIPALIMVMVARYVEPSRQGRAFGMIGSTVAFGEAVGPVIGGAVSDFMHWSFLFVLPLLALLSLPFILRTLPEEPSREGRFDVVGASLLTAGIVAFTLFASLSHWLFLAASALIFGGFAWHIRRASSPFIEPALFGRKKYIAGVAAGAVLLGTVAGYISMVPYMMRDVHQMATSVIGSGVLFPGTVSVILFGIVGGTLVDKRGYRFVMLIGVGMIGASLLGAALFADRTPWLTSAALIVTFGGLSFVKTVVSASVAEALSPEEAGSGMGLLNLACFLAEGIGVAVVGGLLTRRLDFPALPSVTDAAAMLYSNMMLLFMAVILIGGIVFAIVYGQRSGSITNDSQQEA